MADASGLPAGAPDPPGSRDCRPGGATVVISPQATTDAELPADGASGCADSLAIAEAGAPDSGAIDSVVLDAGAGDAPVAARMAIECGDPVSSLSVTGTVEVDVPLTTSASWN